MGASSDPRPPVTVAPGGAWASPLTAQAVAAASLRLGSIVMDGEDVYWAEGRPTENGRTAIVRWTPAGGIAEVTPSTANVRSRVHEYGGAAFAVSAGVVYYSEFNDQRLHRIRSGGPPVALTPPGAFAYADLAVDPLRPRLVCVREDHRASEREATTTLVSVPLDAGSPDVSVLVAGYDFYASPRFSADGTKFAWLAWRHPQMPWDGTELWVADVAADGALHASRCIAGGPNESIFQPGWGPGGSLYFVSDRTGWWNVYRADGNVSVCPMEADCGRPMWQLGAVTWAPAGRSRLLLACAQRGRWKLGTVELPKGGFVPLDVDLEPADSFVATETHAIVLGGGSRRPDAIHRIDLATGTIDPLRLSCAVPAGQAWLSEPRAIEFPTEGGMSAHAFFYPPTNPDYRLPDGLRPPLVVCCHGGPTAATHGRLNLEIQYWTSRGFAVVDVNYGGSTNYGRAYRQRLRGRWGIVDVADVASAVRSLVAEGLANPEQIAIRGRSAGGYTTLAALVFRPDLFKAGASYYGIGDLELLVRDTHKFESRYLDGLIGPYPVDRALYRARSPIDHLDQLSSPLILFQGLEDRVVPPEQAHLMAEAVRAKGSPVVLLTFAGEQHGFRRAGTIVRCLEAELTFYGAIFGFDTPGVPPLPTDNPVRRREPPAGPL